MAEISGISELRQGIASGISRQREKLVADLDALGAQMVAEIRAAAPKRSGALAASVRHEVVGTPDGVRLKIVVGNDVAFYAPFVEFGTSRAPAHPFVRPVVEQFRQRYPRQIEQLIDETWSSRG